MEGQADREQSEEVWPCLLGGSSRPLGCAVSFIDAPWKEVLAAVVELRGSDIRVSGPMGLPDCLGALDPMQAPWTKEAGIDCGQWTAYINNGIAGGDLTAIAPALARMNGWRCIGAQHMPRFGPGHAATQLWIQGPGGPPPLLLVRTVSAYAQDGRWSWHESGEPQPFEDLDRYQARLVRDRLDRALLVRYLSSFGIRADDPSFFGDGVIVTQLVNWTSREESAERFRETNGW
jgi:hypothetical protein